MTGFEIYVVSLHIMLSSMSILYLISLLIPDCIQRELPEATHYVNVIREDFDISVMKIGKFVPDNISQCRYPIREEDIKRELLDALMKDLAKHVVFVSHQDHKNMGTVYTAKILLAIPVKSLSS